MKLAASLIIDLAFVPCEPAAGELRTAKRCESRDNLYSKSLLSQARGRRLREEEIRRIYGLGGVSAGDSVVSAGDSVVSAGDSVVAAGDSVVVAGDSVIEAGLVVSVVVGGLVAAGLATGSVVSVFCSHAARSAALARMQMYFFIMLIGRDILL
jgi:hypothetical protein